jgi:hypothetical protein
MSNIYTLENGTIQIDDDGNPITNIITPLVVTNDTLVLYPHFVTNVDEMRPDLVLRAMYGNSNFIDEIMTLNNVIDSFSLTEGTLLWYPDPTDIDKLRKEPSTQTDQQIIDSLVDPNAERKITYNRETGENLSPTVKPTTLKQISVDTNNNTIKIINTLK